ncbi:MAG: UDP-N-acetylglucosamine 2-epimerase (non-hydrolyzing) [Bacteroidales bacterium]|nr:UDP-N-acetylglucosamine 2-epimerase (non-hydrolyzing) [Bacteroidales bacterium]
MKIVSIVGARPQFIKAATVSRIIRANPEINEILLHTGQHYDENMSDVFFRELNIPVPDYNLGVGSDTHAGQTGKMLKGIEDILLQEKPDCTLVYGDTNSTLAGALAAAKLHIPVAHVEAGLRSFNRIMPEEINRIVTDRISDLLFAPTQTAVKNLTGEGLASITHFTGDVMYDSVLYYRERIQDDPEKYKTDGIPDKYLLATIHRAENTDNHEALKNIFLAFSKLGQDIVLPIHPRTRKIILSSIDMPKNVHIIDPVGYLQMMKLTMDASKVLTDSGGLQKEAYFLGKQCITLRTETEWVETLHDHWNIITGSDPELIENAVGIAPPSTPPQPFFGSGKSAGIILEKLLSF